MAADLDILINIRGEAEKELRKINQELAGVGKQGEQSSKQLGTVDRTFANIKAAAIGAGAGIAAAFVTDHVVNFAKASIGAASDLEESISKTDQVFRDNANTIKDWSDDSATSFGLSQQAALENASTLGNLFTAMEVDSKSASTMSMRLVELGSDLASFNNLSGGTEEALVALRAGLVGEVEPLRRMGVQLSAAAVEAKALELGLAASTAQLTSQDKVMARYQLILEQTTTAQGDFQRTSDGLANQQRILASQWQDMQATIGQGLIPVVIEVTDATNDLMSSPLFQGGVGIATEQLTELTETAGALRDGMDAAAGPLGDVVGWIDDIAPVSSTAADNLDLLTAALPGIGLMTTFSRGLQDGKKALQELGLVARDSTPFDGLAEKMDELIIRAILLAHPDSGFAEVEARVRELTGGLPAAENGFLKMGNAIDEAMGPIRESIERGWLADYNNHLERQAELARNSETAILGMERTTAGFNDELVDLANSSAASRDALDQWIMSGLEAANTADMLGEGYDAAAVSAGVLAFANDNLTAVNDIMNQRIDDSANAISHWEGRVSDVDKALEFLDDQLKIGNVTTDEHATKTAALADFKARLAGGIEDDLIPAFIDEQLAAADLQVAMDDLDQALKDGTISQADHAKASADLRAEFEKQADPIGTLIDKISDLIDALIGLDEQDPTIDITANTDAVEQAIEDMRTFAANNPIVVGVVAGGNDVVSGPGSILPPGDPASSGPRNQRAFQLAGFSSGQDFAIGFADGAREGPPSIKDVGMDSGREFGEGFKDEFGLVWDAVWVDAAADVGQIFENDIDSIFDGSAAAAAQAAADSAKAFMDSWVELGLSTDAPEYLAAQARYEEAMAELAFIAALAGTDSARAYWRSQIDYTNEEGARRFHDETKANVHEVGIATGLVFADGMRMGIEGSWIDYINGPEPEAIWVEGPDWRGAGKDIGNEITLGIDIGFQPFQKGQDDAEEYNAGFKGGLKNPDVALTEPGTAEAAAEAAAEAESVAIAAATSPVGVLAASALNAPQDLFASSTSGQAIAATAANAAAIDISDWIESQFAAGNAVRVTTEMLSAIGQFYGSSELQQVLGLIGSPGPGFQSGPTFNNTFNLSPGTPESLADQLLGVLDQQYGAA